MADIRLVNVTKRYDEVVAVKNMNLEVGDKEFTVFLGPSGCGKTTTLRSIAGLEHPEEGDIFIDKVRVNDLTPADRDIAFVFQFYALYPHMTVYENMAFPLKAIKMPKSEIDERVKEVAAILRISHLLNRKPSKLSGGEMQRVALGRAMVRRPKAFLMDEPLTNLDAKLRAEMRAELKRLQNDIGATTIYVTHDQVEAMSMGDKIAVMNEGLLQQIGTPDEIYNHPSSLFVAGFVGSPAMNLVNCEISEESARAYLQIKSSELKIQLSDEVKKVVEAKSSSRELVLGIRAEDIFVYKENRVGALLATPSSVSSSAPLFETEVYVVEPLGSENIIDLRIGHDSKTGAEVILRARTLPTFTASIGQKLWMDIDKTRMHIFDKQTEKAIV